MQEERDHKGLFDRVKSFIIEDVSDEDSPAAHAPGPLPGSVTSPRRDDVDKMFADIEAEVGGKPAKAASNGPASATSATVSSGNARSAAANLGNAAKVAEEVLTPDVQKVVKLIDALPSVLTKEQIQPLLAATMDAANLNLQTVALQAEDGRKRAEEEIASANHEIARLEAEREETLARLTHLMEAARSQCTEGVSAQQARIGELTAALNTLARISGYLPGAAAAPDTEKTS